MSSSDRDSTAISQFRCERCSEQGNERFSALVLTEELGCDLSFRQRVAQELPRQFAPLDRRISRRWLCIDRPVGHKYSQDSFARKTQVMRRGVVVSTFRYSPTMKLMTITLVGNRSGKAVINWPGVLAATLIVVVVAMAGAGALMFTVGWFSSFGLLFPAIVGALVVVGIGIRRGLQLPPDQLPPLN